MKPSRYQTDPVFREQVKARSRARYKAERERCDAVVRAWCLAHPERRREIARLSARRRKAEKNKAQECP